MNGAGIIDLIPIAFPMRMTPGSSLQILSTKLHQPLSPERLVKRCHLFQLLDDARQMNIAVAFTFYFTFGLLRLIEKINC